MSTFDLELACAALYAQVPSEVADSIKEIADAVIEEAKQDRFYIECLDSGGVDNWEGYSESLQPYWEKYN
jgi:hypothetical protein